MSEGEKAHWPGVGTPNKVTAATRAGIESEVDPIGFLSRVVQGEETFPLTVRNKETGLETKFLQTPTLDQRVHAATNAIQ